MTFLAPLAKTTSQLDMLQILNLICLQRTLVLLQMIKGIIYVAQELWEGCLLHFARIFTAGHVWDLKLKARRISTSFSGPCFSTLSTSLSLSHFMGWRIKENKGETLKALHQAERVSLSSDPSPPCWQAFHESPRILHLDLWNLFSLRQTKQFIENQYH